MAFDPDAWLASKTSSPFDAALAAEGVDGRVADIARSIYQQESGSGKNTKTSNAGAVGGMQIIPATFSRVADKGWAIDNPVHNARAGIRYIKTLYDKSGGDPALTAAGYYGGEGGMAKAKQGIAVSDPRNPNAPNTLQYGQQVASRLPTASTSTFDPDAYLASKVKAPVAEAPNPTGTTFQNVAAGAGKFVMDTKQGIGQLVNDAAAGLENSSPEWLRSGINSLNDKLGLQSAQKTQALGRADIEATRLRDAPLMDTTGGKVGYILGGVSTAPLMPAANTIKGAAALGGAIGAAQPALDWNERGMNTATGAIAGGAGQGVVNGVGRMLSPKTSPEITNLMQQGITPTPGQILGGGFKRAEDGLTSLPVVGDAIKAGQRRAIGDMNTVAMNRALEPVGEALPKGLQGRAAVEHVGSVLSAKYDALLPKLATQADKPFVQELNGLSALVKNGNMGQAESNQFSKILNNQVKSKFQGQASISGETVKQMDGELGRLSSNYLRDPSADKRQLGEAISELQSSLRGLVERTNPDYATELKAINKGYANYKRIERAAAGIGAEDGIFSPAQLQNAVKAMDKSKDKGQFAKGNALMQDLSEPSKKMLGNNVPDSGTPYRLLTTLGATGGASAAGSMVGMGVPAAVGMAAAPIMYTKAGQNIMANLLTKRPESFNKLAELLKLTGGAVGGGSAAYAVQK